MNPQDKRKVSKSMTSQHLISPEGFGLASPYSHFTEFPDPVVVADGQRRVVYLNRAAEELLGCSLDQMEDHPLCTEIVRTEMDGEHHCFIDQCLTKEENLNRVQVRLRNAQGEWSSLAVSATLIRGEDRSSAGCLAILRDLRADLESQPAIQSQIATLESILHNFPVPFFTVGPELTITHMNRHLEKLTGYSREEVLGKMSCARVLNTLQCQTGDCLLKQAMERRLPIAGVRRVVKDRKGNEIPVVANASLITDSAGNVIGGFEAIRDITPIVEAEKKIEQLAEISQEGILMLDEKKRVIFANSRMAEILVVPKKELIGMDASELLSAQHQEMMADLLRNVDQEQQEHLRFCSTIQPVNASAQDQRAFETCMAVSRIGKSILTHIYFRDLTERIDIERQLRQANNFLQNIIQSSVDGIVVVDTSGNVLVFNEGAERILGYKAEEVIGHPEVFPQFYDPQIAREVMRRMRSNDYGPPGKLTTSRINFVRKNGEKIPVNFSAAIIKEGDREIGSVGIFSDLREHERLCRELEQAQIQLVQAEKIASLGRLAAGVAHEINNPLAGILIYADMLMKQIGDHPQLREDLQEIINQTLRSKEIVTRLLEFSRRSLGERVLSDVNKIIGQCTKLLGRQALFHDIKLVFDLDTDLPQILGDPGQLQQVFTNLILNAAHAMHGKGRITISSCQDQESGHVVLKFSDTGPGIPRENIDKIFEPFFTTKTPGEGIGLGLSVVYGVIQRHGGSIEVETPPEGGAVFTMRLPLKPPEDLI